MNEKCVNCGHSIIKSDITDNNWIHEPYQRTDLEGPNWCDPLAFDQARASDQLSGIGYVACPTLTEEELNPPSLLQRIKNAIL